MFGASGTTIPVIDSHIHLFDPTRPGGVPWPEKSDSVLYRPALPPRYTQLAAPHGVAGAIAVECSSWLVDNFWLDEVVEQNPIMLGYIGDLLPEAPDFGATLDRLHRSPRFLGIRYGNLWNRDLGAAAQNTDFVAGLKLLAQAGLVLETANPDAALIAAVVQLSNRVPDLRIVLDHLPHAQIPSDAAARAAYDADLRELSHRPNIYVKGSEIVKRVDGRVSLDAATYKAQLDQLWDLFGEDRIFFGSDWPNSDSLANYDDTFGVAQRYIATRSAGAQQKYFWKNSTAVYRWQPRTAAQRELQK
jgi:predicted TIM-barrel fold metal-dependent hydrolase